MKRKRIPGGDNNEDGGQPGAGEIPLPVSNWADCDQVLVSPGKLRISFDEDSVAKTRTLPRPVGQGKPGTYSEIAIQT